MSDIVQLRVNRQIRASRVCLILEDGKKYGDISISEAQKVADERRMDLVEVSAGPPPICKLLDYSKYKYEMRKKSKGQKTTKSTKEIRISMNIDSHDLDVKKRKIEEFIKNGSKVRFTLELKGRQQQYVGEAKDKFSSCLELFKDFASWEKPQFSNKTFSTTLSALS